MRTTLAPSHERILMRQAVILGALITLMLGLQSPPTFAQDLEKGQQALTMISKFANDLCNRPDLKGKARSVEAQGKAKLEVSKLVKNLADLNIDGAIKFTDADYEGLLQKDLLPALNKSTECKERIFNDLKDRFLPKPGVRVSEEKIEMTMQFKTRNADFLAGAYSLYLAAKQAGTVRELQRQEPQIVKIINFYQELSTGLKSAIYDEPTAKQYFCRDAYYHAFFLWKAHETSYRQGNYAPTADLVFRFRQACPAFDEERTGKPDWVDWYEGTIGQKKSQLGSSTDKEA